MTIDAFSNVFPTNVDKRCVDDQWSEIPVVVNSAALRRETHHGREWLIAPLSMIVDGVLNGSRGPGYYPPKETKAALTAWDGAPITVNHPFDPVTGNSLSAGDAGVLNRQGVGTVLNPAWTDKLVAEGWFDAELTRQRATSVYDDLLAGRPIELSTGLRTFNDPTPGVHNGVPYTWIARNHRPDHLAVLVGQTGACSRGMGCGVNNSDGEKQSLLQKLSDWLGLTDNANPEGCNQYKSCGEATEAGNEAIKGMQAVEGKYTLKQQVSGKTKVSFHKELHEEAFKHATKLEETSKGAKTKELRKIAKDQLDRIGMFLRVHNVEEVDNAGKFGNPQSKETGLFKRMGAGTGKGEEHEAAQRGAMVLTDRDRELGATLVDGVTPAWVADEAQWLKARTSADKGNYPKNVYGSVAAHIYGRLGGKITTNQEDTTMSREQIVDDLVTNCDCWSGGAATLNTLTDEQLKKLKANSDKQRALEATTNQLREAVGAPADLTLNAMPAFIKAKIDAKKKKASDDEDEEDKPKKKTNNKAAVCDEDSDEYDEAECDATENAKPITSRLNPQELQVWNAAVEIEAAARQNLVGQLTANVADAATKTRLVKTLNAKSVPELRDLLLLQPPPVTNRSGAVQPNPMAVFFGAGGNTPVHNARPVDDAKDDVLDLPTMNFSEIVAEQKRKQA